MIRKPKARVQIIQWLKYPKLKRRWEVSIIDDDDENDEYGIPIERFANRDDAIAFGDKLSALIRS